MGGMNTLCGVNHCLAMEKTLVEASSMLRGISSAFVSAGKHCMAPN